MTGSKDSIRSAVAAGETFAAPATPRNIPSLDGLRAVSILIVMVSHSAWYLPRAVSNHFVFHMVVTPGSHGVAVFFVISGYLITTLLLRELRKTDTISLRRFYFRRTLRIFPPFYVFLIVLALLWKGGFIPEQRLSFLPAATYTWALDPHAEGFCVAHSWSLSVEELFYLFWPLLFVIGHRRKQIVNVTLGLIVAMPIVRVVLYFVAPALRGHEGYMVQGWVDTMMVGCMLALLKGQPAWEKWHGRAINAWSAGAMAVTGFLLVPWLESILPHRLSGFFQLSMSYTITAVCIGGILIYVVEHADTIAGRILNHQLVRHIGVISYSLYLWQQVFMFHDLHLLPYGWVYALLAAELSFWIVERPSLALRGWLERRWQA